MNFSEALEKVKAGSAVKRRSWGFVLVLNDEGQLQLVRDDDDQGSFTLDNARDILAEDWEVGAN